MRLRARAMTPIGVRRVIRRLEAIAGRHEQRREIRLDIDAARAELESIVKRMAPDRVDEDLLVALERFVDSFVSDFRREAYERYSADLNELDLLETKLRPYLDWADEVNAEERSKLTHMDGAVSHALDRVVDPDTPYRDPIPRTPRRVANDGPVT